MSPVSPTPQRMGVLILRHLRHTIWGNYRGTGDVVPLVNRTFEWGVVIATFLSALSTVPRHCARLTYFLHPKLRILMWCLLP